VTTAEGACPALLTVEPDDALCSCDMGVWVQPPKCSRQDIRHAGRVLIGKEDGDYAGAVGLISAWRAAHAFPLNTFQVVLRRRAQKVLPTSVVTQRLKRLETIRVKLERFYPHMVLAGMQDIGGCRAIVASVSQLNELRARYQPDVMAPHEFRREKDYIASPKADGYRAYHVVYRYKSESVEQEPWNGLEIEVQMRSIRQHAWASAVETVDFFAKQKIKSGISEGEWAQFFTLFGNSIAEMENQPLAANVSSGEELRRELREVADSLRVIKNLRAWARARHVLSLTDTKGAKFFLVQLDTDSMKVTVTGFSQKRQQAAQAAYTLAEKAVALHPGRQAVLVGAESVAELRRAYASFVVEPKVFIDILTGALKGKRVEMTGA